MPGSWRKPALESRPGISPGTMGVPGNGLGSILKNIFPRKPSTKSPGCHILLHRMLAKKSHPRLFKVNAFTAAGVETHLLSVGHAPPVLLDHHSIKGKVRGLEAHNPIPRQAAPPRRLRGMRTTSRSRSFKGYAHNCLPRQQTSLSGTCETIDSNEKIGFRSVFVGFSGLSQ